MLPHPIHHRMLHKLERRAPLDHSDREALLSLTYKNKTFQPGGYIVREGMPCEESALILEGFAYRQKLTQNGDRQIVSFHIPGDFVDLEGSLLKVADHNVQALTKCVIVAIPAAQILSLIDNHPRIGRALWVDTLIDASIFREWVMNVGRRSAREAVAHLLCELAKRLKLAGLGDEQGFVLPMTQEQLADATGLTPVHVNRTLKALEAEGLISRRQRKINIPDWERLRDASGFSDLYLHLDQAA